MTQICDHCSNCNCTSGTTVTNRMDHCTSEKVIKGEEAEVEGNGDNLDLSVQASQSEKNPGNEEKIEVNPPQIPVAVLPPASLSAGESCLMESSEINSDTTSFSLPKGAPACAICSDPSLYFCKSCKRVSYCSKEHQKQHWKLHQPDCYPVMVQINSLFGTHLVATRDVKRGEVILREKPLVVAPFLSWSRKKCSEESEVSTCLSCHKVIFQGACSKCEWPVCSQDCEKNPTHADQECKIFERYHVQRSALCDKPTQYLCVALLRILLQKRNENCSTSCSNSPPSNPNEANSGNVKWARFMEVVRRQAPIANLNSQLAQPCCCSCPNNVISKSLGSIIHQEFLCSDTEIDQILQTLRTSSFITDSHEAKQEGNCVNGMGSFFTFIKMNNNCNFEDDSSRGSESRKSTTADVPRTRAHSSTGKKRATGKTFCVYHLGSMLTSNCIPNCVWLIQDSTLEFYLRASTPIKTGERISITYVDPLLPTKERKEILWAEKYLFCSCSRCSDPTESCTFISAIKCPGENGEKDWSSKKADGCCEGYLLPTDPLAVAYSSWNGNGSCCCSCCCLCGKEHGGEPAAGALSSADVPHKKLCEAKTGEWKCNVCLMRQPWDLIRRRLAEMRNFLQDVPFITGMIQDENWELENVKMSLEKLDSFAREFTHPNYFIVVKMELEVLASVSKLLERGKVSLEEMEKLAMKMIELCKKGLKVVNVLCPGLSRERGWLLYFLQQALVINLLFKTSRAMRAASACKDSLSSHEELTKKLQEVLLARKEILEIFAVNMGENSEEMRMLRSVQHDSIEIRLLKKHFKHHQSSCSNPWFS